MLRIGICDDLRDARFALRCALEKLLEKRGTEYDLFEFTSGERCLGWFKKNAGKIDLIFLDIEMSGMNGMEAAGELRALDENIQIVFCTGHPDYVFDGYAVGALGYLMKPPDAAKLNSIITRALSALHLSAPQDFVCRNSDGTFRIPKNTVRYFFSEKRTVTCVSETRSYTFYARLDDIEKETGVPFVRIHQRYLVNAQSVERVVKDSVYVDGQSLPISRAYQKQAVLALTRAMLT